MYLQKRNQQKNNTLILILLKYLVIYSGEMLYIFRKICINILATSTTTATWMKTQSCQTIDCLRMIYNNTPHNWNMMFYGIVVGNFCFFFPFWQHLTDPHACYVIIITVAAFHFILQFAFCLYVRQNTKAQNIIVYAVYGMAHRSGVVECGWLQPTFYLVFITLFCHWSKRKTLSKQIETIFTSTASSRALFQTFENRTNRWNFLLMSSSLSVVQWLLPWSLHETMTSNKWQYYVHN